MPTVILGVTGCIGAYKACEVLRELQKADVDVHVVMTEHATRFVSAMTFEALSQHPVFVDQFALGENGDIRHISLADAADLLLVAPATANAIGKFARGIADDALSTLYLATRAPVLMAPAMNVNMFDHPAVRENLETLRARGVGIIEPGSGYLACGWLGKGRLAEVPEIVAAARARLAASPARGDAPTLDRKATVREPRPTRPADLASDTIVVTAGPTVEDIDPVRFISNRSTGRMGYRLAETARDRGARVILVSGPTSLPTPFGVEVVPVRSSEEMARAIGEKVGGATIVAMAAAVSDYRPAAVSPTKIKKGDGEGTTLALTRTTDILRTLGVAKGDRLLIGFAAETDHLVANARKKRKEKRLDLIVANEVGREGTGFAADENQAVLIDETGEIPLPRMGKRELADRIWDRVLELRRHRAAAVTVTRRA